MVYIHNIVLVLGFLHTQYPSTVSRRRSGRAGGAVRPVQEGRRPVCQVAVRAEDRRPHAVLPLHAGERQRARQIRLHLSAGEHNATFCSELLPSRTFVFGSADPELASF